QSSAPTPRDPGFESLRRYQFSFLSSAAEHLPDKRESQGRYLEEGPIQRGMIDGQTVDSSIRTRSLKPEWRGSGLLTRRPVDRNHPGPPNNRTWTSYRSGRTGRPLKPAAQAHRRFESCLVLQCVCTPIGRGECVENAFSGRSSRPRRTNSSLLRYASGEATGLSNR